MQRTGPAGQEMLPAPWQQPIEECVLRLPFLSVTFRTGLSLALLTGLPVLTACSVFEAPAQMRGVHLDQDQLHQLVPGTSTRADVTSILGTPTAHASFDDNSWIYIGQVTRQRVARIQGVESQNVVVVQFDQNGVLKDVRKLNDSDAKSVDVVSRSTPSPGSSASFMQQLLGNIGRYSPGGIGSMGSSPGGSTLAGH